MSRVAKEPVKIESGVDVSLNGQQVSVKGLKGSLSMVVNQAVAIGNQDGSLNFAPVEGKTDGWAQAGTARALVQNMILGVSQGFEKRLTLIGVGYRASIKDNQINLSLGFSHPVIYKLPVGVAAEILNQTEIVLKSADKQLLGKVAAEIRSFRPPEPYKGKGVRYSDENVRRKDAKKK
tara:strand:+ start:544 stop:1077 length:534 start_codon:yes stop_codon:yes gene_type:complete